MVRYIIGIVSGAFVTASLLFLMNFLIENGEQVVQDPRERLLLDFVRVKQAGNRQSGRSETREDRKATDSSARRAAAAVR